MPKGKPLKPNPRVFNNPKAFAHWLINLAGEEQNKANRQKFKQEQCYYNGKTAAYSRIGHAIDQGQIILNFGANDAPNGEESPAEARQASDRPRSDEPDSAG